MSKESLDYAIFQNTKYIRNLLDNMNYIKWNYDIHAEDFKEGESYLLAIKTKDNKKPVKFVVAKFDGMYFSTEDDYIYLFNETIAYIPTYDLNYCLDYKKIK